MVHRLPASGHRGAGRQGPGLGLHPWAAHVGEGQEQGDHRGHHRRGHRPLERPETVVAGLVRDGELHIVGKTTPLTTAQAAELAAR